MGWQRKSGVRTRIRSDRIRMFLSDPVYKILSKDDPVFRIWLYLDPVFFLMLDPGSGSGSWVFFSEVGPGSGFKVRTGSIFFSLFFSRRSYPDPIFQRKDPDTGKIHPDPQPWRKPLSCVTNKPRNTQLYEGNK